MHADDVTLTPLEAEVLYDAATNVADWPDAREALSMTGARGAALTRAMGKLRAIIDAEAEGE